MIPKSKVFLGFPTPCLVLLTYLGQLLYSPADLKIGLEPVLGLMDIADMVHKDFGSAPLRELCRPAEGVSYLLSYRGSNGPAVNANSNGIHIDTKSGRKQVTMEQYAERMALDRPAAVIAMADEVVPDAGHKRIKKAAERNRIWLAATQKAAAGLCPVLGVCPASAPEGVQALTSSGVQGIVASGIYDLPAQRRREVLQAMSSALPLPLPLLVLQDHPLRGAAYGPQGFADMLQDILHGADVVYSTYPLRLTQQGRAFSMIPVPEPTPSAGSKRPRPSTSEEVQRPTKRARGDAAALTPAPVAEDTPSGAEEAFSLDLWDGCYARDTLPLVPGCGCHACLHHSRAYVHHLLVAKELLAEVLLYQHNQFALLAAFKDIRAAASEGQEALGKWIEQIGKPWHCSDDEA